MIDQELLHRLEGELARHAVTWLSRLRRGDGRREVALEGSTGNLALPPELVQLWEWFDLAGDPDDGLAPLTPLYRLLTLDSAVWAYAEYRDVALDIGVREDARAAGFDAEHVWPQDYLPLLKAYDPDLVAVDITQQDDESPLFFVDIYGNFDRRTVRAPSIVAFLARVCELYEQNAYVWVNEPAGHWVYQGPGEDPLTSPHLL